MFVILKYSRSFHSTVVTKIYAYPKDFSNVVLPYTLDVVGFVFHMLHIRACLYMVCCTVALFISLMCLCTSVVYSIV